jgi:hypothetical protein
MSSCRGTLIGMMVCDSRLEYSIIRRVLISGNDNMHMENTRNLLHIYCVAQNQTKMNKKQKNA